MKGGGFQTVVWEKDMCAWQGEVNGVDGFLADLSLL
jgi:hypothetical protein